jgi:hypothetical protein
MIKNFRTHSLPRNVLLLMLAACGRTSAKDAEPSTVQSAQIASDDALLTGDSVGPAIVGVAPSALSPRIKVIRDTIEEGMEGIPESIAILLVAGDTIRAAIDSGRIYRFSVTSARFRTTDSLGVGTPLSRLLSEPGIYAMTGEGAVFVWSASRCGLGFRLWDVADREAAWDPGRLGDAPDSVGVAELRRLPQSTTVGEVIVVGCQQKDRDTPA